MLSDIPGLYLLDAKLPLLENLACAIPSFISEAISIILVFCSSVNRKCFPLSQTVFLRLGRVGLEAQLCHLSLCDLR
jgi:hypothetical protein